jgi:hypothetical protein
MERYLYELRVVIKQLSDLGIECRLRQVTKTVYGYMMAELHHGCLDLTFGGVGVQRRVS